MTEEQDAEFKEAMRELVQATIQAQRWTQLVDSMRQHVNEAWAHADWQELRPVLNEYTMWMTRLGCCSAFDETTRLFVEFRAGGSLLTDFPQTTNNQGETND